MNIVQGNNGLIKKLKPRFRNVDVAGTTGKCQSVNCCIFNSRNSADILAKQISHCPSAKHFQQSHDISTFNHPQRLRFAKGHVPQLSNLKRVVRMQI